MSATLPAWDLRSDQANATLRVDKQRTEVAKCRTAFAQAEEQLRILEDEERETLGALVAAANAIAYGPPETEPT